MLTALGILKPASLHLGYACFMVSTSFFGCPRDIMLSLIRALKLRFGVLLQVYVHEITFLSYSDICLVLQSFLLIMSMSLFSVKLNITPTYQNIEMDLQFVRECVVCDHVRVLYFPLTHPFKHITKWLFYSYI